jgi:hypothetical protein
LRDGLPSSGEKEPIRAAAFVTVSAKRRGVAGKRK